VTLLLVLGIESSCDETSVALYDGVHLLNRTTTQEVHQAWGGVVPELASRDHQRLIIPMILQVAEDWGLKLEALEGIAVTAGPGLVGALLVGLNVAKGMAMGLKIPFIAVNHLEGHLWVHSLEKNDIEPPFLSLIVSGGHTELVRVDDFGSYVILGRTRDDAAGEALDKLGVLFGLTFPAGPDIDQLSREGDGRAFDLPRGMVHDGLDFSFSGLKTAVRVLMEQERDRVMLNRANVLASVQEAVMEVLAVKVSRAMEQTGITAVSVSGGVSANSRLRELISARANREGFRVVFPAHQYCTDNAAMIAWVGRKRLMAGEQSGLDTPAQPGWMLESLSPPVG
jgi:N6-L-threonylcarbamoyladenine synthase